MAPLGVKLWTWVWNLWGWVYGLAAWFVNWALGLCGGLCSAVLWITTGWVDRFHLLLVDFQSWRGLMLLIMAWRVLYPSQKQSPGTGSWHLAKHSALVRVHLRVIVCHATQHSWDLFLHWFMETIAKDISVLCSYWFWGAFDIFAAIWMTMHSQAPFHVKWG